MSTNISVHKGLYAQAVRDCALSWVGQGGDFTVKGFAEKCGFKVTHNLRRRLAELVKEGLLSYTPIYNGDNHLVGLYHANPTPQTTDESKHPF